LWPFYEKIVPMRALFIAAAVALLAMPVAADPSRERAALVAIDLGPNAPIYLRATAASQLEAGLTAAGYELVPADEVSARLTGALASCRGGTCVRLVGAALGARSLVFVTIDGSEEHTAFAMRVHDGRTGELEAELHEVCTRCGQTEFSVRLGAAAATLHARALAHREAASPAKALPEPAPGLTPAPPAREASPGPAPSPASRSIVPGILVGVAGAIAVGGGLYLMAIDGDGTCARGDQPVYPAPGAVIRYPDPSDLDHFVCRKVYETQAPGITAAGVGVAALAAGVALVVRARTRGRSAEVAPRRGGATIGLSWTW
jgi:hypothetical protein